MSQIEAIELSVMEPHLADPSLRGLIISPHSHTIFWDIMSRYDVDRYNALLMKATFPEGGTLYVFPSGLSEHYLAGLDFNLISVGGPYPDTMHSTFLSRLKAYPGDTISPQIFRNGHPLIGEKPDGLSKDH